MEVFSQIEETFLSKFLDSSGDELADIKRFFREKPMPFVPIGKKAQDQPASKAEEKTVTPGIKPGSKLFGMFHTGAGNQSKILSSGLQSLGTNPTLEKLEPITRAAHSLKGSARIVGLHAPASLANAMERVLLSAQSGSSKLSPKLVLTLQKGAEFFSRMAETNIKTLGLWLSQQETLIERLTKAMEDGNTDVADLIFTPEPTMVSPSVSEKVLVSQDIPSPEKNTALVPPGKDGQEQVLDEQTSKILGKYTIKVLLIDDEVFAAERVRQMLSGEKDIVFYSVQDPWQAFQKALEIEPTVILQDLVMPDVDGLQMVHFFRNQACLAGVPLIILSSREEALTKAEAFAKGANDYLVKLPDKIELIARIRYHSKGYINLLERNDAFSALVKSRRELADELSYATKYIISLLPKPVKEGPIQAEWRFIPSTELGGDSFWYHWLKPNLFAMFLLDVSGHGVKSALLSVTALNDLKARTLPGVDFSDPAQVCTCLNETFQMERHNNLNFTIWYGVFDTTTGMLTHAAAGHPPALLYGPGGQAPVEVVSENALIGAFPGIPFTSKTQRIEPGSIFYVFSDGVYEVNTPSGDYWDLDGLKNYLGGERASREGELDALYQYLLEYSKSRSLRDDYSIMKIRFG